MTGSLIRRIFLAVPVPNEVAAYRELLKETNRSIEGIKWTRLHNLHLTGYFIGNIPSERFDEVVSAIAPVLQAQSSFTLQFDSISFAPSRNARMIWGRYKKHEQFTALSESMHAALGEYIATDKFHYKEPVPHITLARFHPKVGKTNPIKLPPVTLPALRVEGIELWESKPSPEGVRYESIATFAFAQ